MRWAIIGCDRESGEDIQLTVDAASEEEATGKASKKGILVAECRPAEIALASEAVKRPSTSARSSPRPATAPSPVQRSFASPAIFNLESPDEALPELPLAVPPSSPGFGTLPALLGAHPLVGTAAILHFVWAVVMLVIGMIQVANDSALLGLWNIAVAAAYVVIGIGIIRGRHWSYTWGVASNVLNGLSGIIQIAAHGVPIMAALLILEVLNVIFLVRNRRLFPVPIRADGPGQHTGDSTPWNRFLRGGLLGMMDERFCTITSADIAVTGATTQQKVRRLAFIAVGTIGGFVLLIAVVVGSSDMMSRAKAPAGDDTTPISSPPVSATPSLPMPSVSDTPPADTATLQTASEAFDKAASALKMKLAYKGRIWVPDYDSQLVTDFGDGSFKVYAPYKIYRLGDTDGEASIFVAKVSRYGVVEITAE